MAELKNYVSASQPNSGFKCDDVITRYLQGGGPKNGRHPNLIRF